MTSNPSIFEKAIGESDEYDGAVKAFVAKGDAEVDQVFEHLAIADIQAAADQLRVVHDRTGGRDGFVSLEVSPYLAMDTEQTIAEARRLWAAVNRPNLMIKVPGTEPGVPAIRTLIGAGINVNVTLLFSLDAYLAVAEAHMAGLEALKAKGGDIGKVAGVASFFVSRIDTEIDKKIDAKLKAGAGADEAALKAVRGKVAIANAKIAYQRYLQMIDTPRWKALAAKGAAPQRLLWASTGTKNPDYPDTLYIDSLIGADTVNTMPPKTMDAFRDHGTVRPALTEDVAGAEHVLTEAERLGLNLDEVTDRLVVDGVRQFADAADKLYAAVAKKRAAALGGKLNAQRPQPSDDLIQPLAELTEPARAEGWSRRMWSGDKSLWTGADEDKWLGWLPAGARRAASDFGALKPSPPRSPAPASSTRCCWAWADRASGRRCWPRPSARDRVTRSSWCWIPPTRTRSPGSRPRSTPPRPCSSSPASPARRSSPTCCTAISSIGWRERSARPRPVAISSP